MNFSNPAWRRRPLSTAVRVAWSLLLKRFPPHEPLVVPFDEGKAHIYADMRTAFGRQLYRYGESDPDLAFVRTFLRPGDVFIDGGAHHGMFTIVASRAVGPTGAVRSFEPNPKSYDALIMNVRLNHLENVEAHAFALGEADGEAWFTAMDGDRAPWSHLGQACASERARSLTVRVVALANSIPVDLWDRIGLIKLDVEGAELHALRGAEPILDAVHPPILMEYVPRHFEAFGVDPLDVLSYLRDRGYMLLRPTHDPEVWIPCSFDDPMRLDPKRPNLLAAVDLERLRRRGVEVPRDG